MWQEKGLESKLWHQCFHRPVQDFRRCIQEKEAKGSRAAEVVSKVVRLSEVSVHWPKSFIVPAKLHQRVAAGMPVLQYRTLQGKFGGILPIVVVVKRKCEFPI